ncbi:transcriptional regulator [Bacillus pumilus]|jgi:AcrR family transcriptional regulator|uniref:TetR/AcrR family transcriptional regulator n=1 Tax=Bacillus TaxID=1386 RepID=UPI0006401DBD|nr:MULTISPECIES: TetR/AcrR family transcriptional regulator [Bacillus]KLK99982.1 transcriptional regulator [Bacillus pumilus]KUF22294.1 transcriptional regulator [Bacillus sp. G1(2015b)]KUR59293.1 transcriptional regulator [Bacillus sp. AM 13(2015)]MBR0602468.1 TetR/AcrR family transcriptional regulator [Bacillus safensis]MBR0639842.1 TetR/AcrR family transcriptional regulator [Bacillus safensis]
MKRAMTDEAKALRAQAILDKAAELFETHEYNQIKMSDIAKETKLSKGILFVYFKTKEALFFQLLCREYIKRLERFIEIISETQIKSLQDIKHLFLKELEEIIDKNPIYIRLEAIRTSVLERNVDSDGMLQSKMLLFKKLKEMTDLLCSNDVINEAQVMDIFQAEAAIITGCKLTATLPDEVITIIENHNMHEFKRDFKTDVMNTMSFYLDGYLHNLEA